MLHLSPRLLLLALVLLALIGVGVGAALWYNRAP